MVRENQKYGIQKVSEYICKVCHRVNEFKILSRRFVFGKKFQDK